MRHPVLDDMRRLDPAHKHTVPCFITRSQKLIMCVAPQALGMVPVHPPCTASSLPSQGRNPWAGSRTPSAPPARPRPGQIPTTQTVHHRSCAAMCRMRTRRLGLSAGSCAAGRAWHGNPMQGPCPAALRHQSAPPDAAGIPAFNFPAASGSPGLPHLRQPGQRNQSPRRTGIHGVRCCDHAPGGSGMAPSRGRPDAALALLEVTYPGRRALRLRQALLELSSGLPGTRGLAHTLDQTSDPVSYRTTLLDSTLVVWTPSGGPHPPPLKPRTTLQHCTPLPEVGVRVCWVERGGNVESARGCFDHDGWWPGGRQVPVACSMPHAGAALDCFCPARPAACFR